METGNVRPESTTEPVSLGRRKKWLDQIAEFECETDQTIIRRCIRALARKLGITPSSISDAPNRRGPTEKTRIRAEVFKRIKEEHRDWNTHRVALEASEELSENLSSESVRNAYRAMGWDWERADRVR